MDLPARYVGPLPIDSPLLTDHVGTVFSGAAVLVVLVMVAAAVSRTHKARRTHQSPCAVADTATTQHLTDSEKDPSR
ncbi:MAG: hypothetical protein CME34_03140 [Gordonia sp.]|uniref:hypothetical protein n=1 Tax=Gordonia sp. (in: high G+C Gram-positive bacteria) TaxID=84139 RepID=UPI000C4C65AA|nr:hypothetical protein [Gordonia sp. (in: high G+C Gram-positive bacteria)]MAU80865.1 hypothetical protein [Gordonia sp. (in: high G+C Gram-positive bacteria)]